MKLPLEALALVIGCAALAACSSPQAEITLRNFDWSVVGNTAPFSFELENATAEEVSAIVFVLAESRRESRAGTRLSDIGRERVEVSLGPKEKKKISGSVHLASTGDVVLQTSLTVKRPNQSLQHNAGAAPFADEALRPRG